MGCPSWSWWHHQMETFSTVLALCEGNPLVTSRAVFNLLHRLKNISAWNEYDMHFRNHFLYAPSQWETLHCNTISHWLGACTKWSLAFCCCPSIPCYIWVPSYERHGVSIHWQLYCLLFVQQFVWPTIKIISKLCFAGPLWGGSTSNQWIPKGPINNQSLVLATKGQ